LGGSAFSVSIPSRYLGPNARPPTPQAWFNFSTDLSFGTSWPQDYHPYTLFAGTRSSSSAADLDLMRKTGEGTTWLAYVNAQDLPIHRGFDNAYNLAYQAAWDTTSFCVFNLATNKVWRVAGYMQWIPRKTSADSCIRVQRDWLLSPSPLWDGLYIDECYRDYPAFKESALPASFDCDGDGQADTVAKLEAQWHEWRPYLTAGLRTAAGSSKILIANTAGPLSDPALNGITIERVGEVGKTTVSQAITAFVDQRSVGRQPFYGVVWPVTAANVPAALQVVRTVGGVYFGVTSGDPHNLP
jgi:hypothetical protein